MSGETIQVHGLKPLIAAIADVLHRMDQAAHVPAQL